MRSGNRTRKSGKKGETPQPKVLRLKGDRLEKALVEIYNDIMTGIQIIFDCAMEGDPEAVRAIVLLADEAIERAGQCRKAVLQTGARSKRRRR